MHCTLHDTAINHMKLISSQQFKIFILRVLVKNCGAGALKRESAPEI